MDIREELIAERNRRESQIIKEMDNAIYKIWNDPLPSGFSANAGYIKAIYEEEKCKDAYYRLIDFLYDEIGQRMGFPPTLIYKSKQPSEQKP